MELIAQVLGNRVLVSTVCGWFFAQLLKMIIEVIKGGFSIERLKGSGGMPSSHSATVCALALSTAITEGPGSTQFAIAFFFAIIVMYDAMGVRHVTGEQSRILNRLKKRDEEEGRSPLYEGKLEEKMGHTVPEIGAGMLVGFLTAAAVCALMR